MNESRWETLTKIACGAYLEAVEDFGIRPRIVVILDRMGTIQAGRFLDERKARSALESEWPGLSAVLDGEDLRPIAVLGIEREPDELTARTVLLIPSRPSATPSQELLN